MVVTLVTVSVVIFWALFLHAKYSNMHSVQPPLISNQPFLITSLHGGCLKGKGEWIPVVREVWKVRKGEGKEHLSSSFFTSTRDL